MTSRTLDARVLRRLRDRQGLLWVCQPYDLIPNAQPHSLAGDPDAVRNLYRADVSDSDRGFAALFWEAIWLEGADSPILRALRSATERDATAGRRPVVLAGAEDAEAAFSEHQFLSVSVLPGLLDPQASPGARFGGLKERVRQQIAIAFAKRLERYPHRVLIVLGVPDPNQLQKHLYPALEDNRVLDLDVVIVQPDGVSPVAGPDNAAVRLHVWTGTEEELLSALKDAGVPSIDQAAEWTVRLKAGEGKTVSVRMSPDAMQKTLDQFELITEKDLRQPNSFSIEDLTAFLSGTADSWTGYAAGLPVPRDYIATNGHSLQSTLLSALRHTEQLEPSKSIDNAPQRRATTLALPCAGGSGATTLLRAAAFESASEGYPTLFLRTGITEIDTEVVVAFAIAISELALANGLATAPPLSVVLDAECANVRTAKQLAAILASQGRPNVVLVAVHEDREQQGYLAPLRAETTPNEARRCEATFRELVERWNLPVDHLPTLEEWLAYEKHSRWVTPTGADSSKTLFWVALRFFLTGGLARREAETVHDALGRWVAERDARVKDEGMRKVLRWVAALSSQRILCPLMLALRPVTGGSFSTSLIPVLQELADLVDWQDYSPDFGDYTVRFRHPALAEEYLRKYVGDIDPRAAVQELVPLLRQLIPGRPADMWLAERVVMEVLTPHYEDRRLNDWTWRLEAFDMFPKALVMDSRPMLHHWSRCLYQSADLRNDPEMPTSERRERFEKAISNLQHALQLPRRQVREEHPSHLWNTLGVAWSRLARFLDSVNSPDARHAWDEAWSSFQKSIDLFPANDEAILAFGHRLLDHAGVFDTSTTESSETAVDEVARALSLLDDAEEFIEKSQDPDYVKLAELKRDRTHALEWLGQEQVSAYLRQLKSSDNPELGFYCEAQLVAKYATNADGIDHAISILEEAAQITPLGERSLRLLVSLFRQHASRRFNFEQLLGIYEKLELAVGAAMHPVEQFRHAVLCFQVGKFGEGEGRFRRLRELSRRGDLTTPTVRDVWRKHDQPAEPRPTQVRVSRLISEWRAEGFAEELGQTIPLRPRHFRPMPKVNDVVPCFVRFEFNGPLAIPTRFIAAEETAR